MFIGVNKFIVNFKCNFNGAVAAKVRFRCQALDSNEGLYPALWKSFTMKYLAHESEGGGVRWQKPQCVYLRWEGASVEGGTYSKQNIHQMEQVSMSSYGITNHPKALWLKSTHVYYLSQICALAGQCFWLGLAKIISEVSWWLAWIERFRMVS